MIKSSYNHPRVHQLPGLLVAAAASWITLAAAQAQIISGSFSDSSAPFGFGPFYILSSTEVAGAEPADNWNNITSSSGSATDLLDVTGTATTLDTSISGSLGFWGFFSASGSDNRMLGAGHEYNTSASGGMTLTLSQIPYALYDIYVYVGWNADRIDSQYSLSIGSTTYYGETGDPAGGGPGLVQITSTTSGSPTLNSTYAVFSGLSGSSQSILLDITGGPGTPGALLAGFQVVEVIPEPSTYALLGLGLGALWFLRRRMAS